MVKNKQWKGFEKLTPKSKNDASCIVLNNNKKVLIEIYTQIVVFFKFESKFESHHNFVHVKKRSTV